MIIEKRSVFVKCDKCGKESPEHSNYMSAWGGALYLKWENIKGKDYCPDCKKEFQKNKS